MAPEALALLLSPGALYLLLAPEALALLLAPGTLYLLLARLRPASRRR